MLKKVMCILTIMNIILIGLSGCTSQNPGIKVKYIDNLESIDCVNWLNDNEILINKVVGSEGAYPKLGIFSYNVNDKELVPILSKEDDSYECIGLSDDKKHLIFAKGYKMMHHKTIGILELSSKKETIVAGGLSGIFFIDNENIAFYKYQDPEYKLYVADLNAKIKESYSMPNNLNFLGFDGKKLLFIVYESEKELIYESNIDMSDLKIQKTQSQNDKILFSVSTKDKTQTIIVKNESNNKKPLVLVDATGKEKDVLLDNSEFMTYDSLRPNEDFIHWMPGEKAITIEKFTSDNVATLIVMDVNSKKSTTLFSEKNVVLGKMIFDRKGKSIIVNYSPTENGSIKGGCKVISIE